MMETGRILERVGAEPQHQLHGVYGASCYNNRDPKGEGRIEMRVPQVLGTAISNWAERMSFPSNKGVPPIGEFVLAMFIGGDINRPAYMAAATSFAPLNQTSAWSAITLSGGWSNVGGSISAQYRTLSGGDIEVIGNIQSGTTTDDTTIGTVPVLPAHAHTFGVSAVTGAAAVSNSVTTGFASSTTGSLTDLTGTLNNIHGSVDSGTQIPTSNFTITSGSLPFQFGPGGQQFTNNAGASNITLNSSGLTLNNGGVNVSGSSVSAQTTNIDYNTPCIKIDTSGNLKILNINSHITQISFHHTIPATA